VLRTYIKPFITSRKSTVRLLPPRLPGGISGATCRYLFGTTETGGGTGCGGAGCGTIYQVENNGKENVLYAFTDGTDGADPVSDMFGSGKGGTAGKKGYLYGTAYQGGGSGCGGTGCGTVFTLKY
jgi:hypothetical protein